MFLLPLGLLGGADLSIADTIVKNFIPTTIGNAIAGAVVVAAGYSFQFGKLGNATKL
jgi:formate/nitrite transporter FocA (FNT family)